MKVITINFLKLFIYFIPSDFICLETKRFTPLDLLFQDKMRRSEGSKGKTLNSVNRSTPSFQEECKASSSKDVSRPVLGDKST